jgi:hypothetical protein
VSATEVIILDKQQCEYIGPFLGGGSPSENIHKYDTLLKEEKQVQKSMHVARTLSKTHIRTEAPTSHTTTTTILIRSY